jgi:hypothetical protein
MKLRELNFEEVRMLADKKRMTLHQIAKLVGSDHSTVHRALKIGRKEWMARMNTEAKSLNRNQTSNERVTEEKK